MDDEIEAFSVFFLANNSGLGISMLKAQLLAAKLNTIKFPGFDDAFLPNGQKVGDAIDDADQILDDIANGTLHTKAEITAVKDLLDAANNNSHDQALTMCPPPTPTPCGYSEAGPPCDSPTPTRTPTPTPCRDYDDKASFGGSGTHPTPDCSPTPTPCGNQEGFSGANTFPHSTPRCTPTPTPNPCRTPGEAPDARGGQQPTPNCSPTPTPCGYSGKSFGQSCSPNCRSSSNLFLRGFWWWHTCRWSPGG